MRQLYILALSVLVLLAYNCSSVQLYTNLIEDTLDQVLAPGDIISIRNLKNRHLISGEFPVEYRTYGNSPSVDYIIDQTGQVQVPELGYVQLGGMAEKQAEAYLTDLYSRTLLIAPLIDIRVTNPSVVLIGEFARPGRIVIRQPLVSFSEVLAEAGGLSVGASGKIVITRNKGLSLVGGRQKFIYKAGISDPGPLILKNDIVCALPKRLHGHTGNLTAAYQHVLLPLNIYVLLRTIFR